MATSTAPPQTTTHRREMEEIRPPEMFSFQKPGEKISGVLLSIDTVTVKGKSVVQYTLRTADNRRLQILATYDLGRKIQAQHRGCLLEITYIGENQDVRKGDNYLREFKVLAEKRQPGDPEITDADIPF